MPFINGIWTDPIKELPNSIDISSSSVNLTHITSGESVGEYKMTFGVVVFSHQFDFNDPSIVRKVNKASLKKAIYNSLKASDQKYFEIEKFSMNSATFIFSWRKWFKDATQSITPKTHMSKFEKTFTFKVKLPDLLAFNFSPYTDLFMVKKFRDYASERRMDEWFKGYIPKEYESRIRSKTSDMFDYSYDRQFNRISLRLKNIYILGILFAVGQTVNSQMNKQPYVKVNFNEKVKDRANKFDRQKWETFIKRKFI